MKSEFLKIRKDLGDRRASVNAAVELDRLIPGPAGRSPFSSAALLTPDYKPHKLRPSNSKRFLNSGRYP